MQSKSIDISSSSWPKTTWAEHWALALNLILHMLMSYSLKWRLTWCLENFLCIRSVFDKWLWFKNLVAFYLAKQWNWTDDPVCWLYRETRESFRPIFIDGFPILSRMVQNGISQQTREKKLSSQPNEWGFIGKITVVGSAPMVCLFYYYFVQ